MSNKETTVQEQASTSPGSPTTQAVNSKMVMERLFDRLPGERDVMNIAFTSVNDCVCLLYPIDDAPIAISFILTTFRIVALPEHRLVPPISIPLMMVESFFGGKEGPFFFLEIHTKHVWHFKFGFRRDMEVVAAKRALEGLKPKLLAHVPAFDLYAAWMKSTSSSVVPDPLGTQTTTASSERKEGVESSSKESTLEDSSMNYGWTLFDPEAELLREICFDPAKPVPDADSSDAGVGKDLRPWYRLSHMNQPDNTFGANPTYPFRIVVPTTATDEFIVSCFSSRSKGRIPAISFVHLGTGGVIARSSQPLYFKQRAEDGILCGFLVNPYTPQSAQPRIFEQSIPSNSWHSSPTRTQSPRPSPGVANNGGAGWKPPPSLVDENSPLATSKNPNNATNSTQERDGSSPNSRAQHTDPFSLPPTRPTTRILQIFDLRPQGAAAGNMAFGGGFETGAFYEHCKVTFCGIENIHAVSASWNKLRNLVHNFSGKNTKGDFYKEWDGTGWIDHIQKVLTSAVNLTDYLSRGESVLAHCTDGWDRTSQVTSLAMMMLDPYFRTIHGFCVLIDKEFCSFGHKFAERCGTQLVGETYCAPETFQQSDVAKAGDHKLQPSPIFIQWLDCVYQLLRQFPDKFEFSPLLLEFLSIHVYSGCYGTFLTNTSKERMFEGIRQKTMSIWSAIELLELAERKGERPLQFLNPLYDATTAATYIRKESNCGIQRITPSLSSKRLVFWEEFYLKHDPDLWTIGMNKHMQFVQQILNPTLIRIPPSLMSNAITILHDLDVAAASQRRKTELAFMKDLLPRLQVAKPPQEKIAQAGGDAGGGGTVVVKPEKEKNPKECRKCRDKFGWFSQPQFCQQCFMAFCGKCLKSGPPTYQKLCESCFAFQEVEYREEM